MDDLYKAVAPFSPSSSGSGGGGFNSPPGPSDNSWIVNSSSAEELRRDQEVGETPGHPDNTLLDHVIEELERVLRKLEPPTLSRRRKKNVRLP